MIVADENIAAAIVARLRSDGWEVTYIAEVSPSVSDREVLERALDAGAVVLTDDKDFGELVVHEKRPHSGVVLLRLAGVPIAQRAEMVSKLFSEQGEQLRNAFTVFARDGKVRRRLI